MIEEEVLLWITVTSGVEGLSRTEDSMDETCMVAAGSVDGESTDTLS